MNLCQLWSQLTFLLHSCCSHVNVSYPPPLVAYSLQPRFWGWGLQTSRRQRPLQLGGGGGGLVPQRLGPSGPRAARRSLQETREHRALSHRYTTLHNTTTTNASTRFRGNLGETVSSEYSHNATTARTSTRFRGNLLYEFSLLQLLLLFRVPFSRLFYLLAQIRNIIYWADNKNIYFLQIHHSPHMDGGLGN